MQSRLERRILAVLAPCLILAAWLWMTAVESEEEFEAPEWTVPERFRNEPKLGPLVDPDEIDTTKIQEPEPHYGWIVPPEQVRKAAGKVKRKVKRAVKKS